MKRCVVMFALAGVALALAGCNTMAGQPRFVSAGLEPPVLSPGALGLLKVELKDKQKIVAGVTASIPEYPDSVLKLNDSGLNGDEKAGDGTWSFAVKVPAKAPEGEFAVQLAAWRSDGVQITVRDKDGNITYLTAVIPARVAPPVEEEAPAPEPAPAMPEPAPAQAP